MKIYLKNRTQIAKYFTVAGKMMIGFLICDDGRAMTILSPTGKRTELKTPQDKNKDQTKTEVVDERKDVKEEIIGRRKIMTWTGSNNKLHTQIVGGH